MFKKLFFEILISEQKQEKLLEFPMNNSLCGNEEAVFDHMSAKSAFDRHSNIIQATEGGK